MASDQTKRERQERYRRKLFLDAIKAYGGKCVSCPESNPIKLEFHHPNGGGNTHRASIFGRGHDSPGGWNFCLWLKKNGYPPIVELRCKDCHDELHPNRKAHPGRRPGEEELQQELELLDPVPF